MFTGKKRKAHLTDFVTQYCSERDGCSSKTCPLLSTTGTNIEKSDVAYIEVVKCPKYRPIDGGLSETEINEMGVWKDGA